MHFVKISANPKCEFLTLINFINKARFFNLSQSDHYFHYIEAKRNIGYGLYDTVSETMQYHNQTFYDYALSKSRPRQTNLLRHKCAMDALIYDKPTFETVSLVKEDSIPELFDCMYIPSKSNDMILIIFTQSNNVLNLVENADVKLTSRERTLINMVLRGMTYKTIASFYRLSEGSVKKILTFAYKKLGITSRNDLFAIIIKQYAEVNINDKLST